LQLACGFVFSLCYACCVRKIHPSAWALVVLSAILQVLIFQPVGWYVFSWVALAPLVFALLRARPAPGLHPEGSVILQPATPLQAFVLSYVCGVLWYCGTCYWVMDTMHRYGGVSQPVAFLLMLGMCCWVAWPMGIFGFLLVAVRSAGRDLRRSLLLAPFFWVTMELIQSRVLGFPWNLLGTAQVDNVALCRVASWGGVYAVSFEIALVNTALAAAFLIPRRKRAPMLLAGIAAAVVLQVGVLLDPPASVHDRTALLLQQNIPPATDAQWTRPQLTDTLQDLTKVTLSALDTAAGAQASPIDGIIWPESPAPFFSNDPEFRSAVSSLAQRAKTWVVAGVIGVDNATGLHPQLAFNSAALAGPNGEWAGRYDKIHLVPFGEFVPLRRYMPFMDMLTREVGEFDRGTSRAPLDAGGSKAGVFICYESVFPGEVREFAQQGAQVLINISNDGWYGDSGAYLQHLNMTRMRAVENNRWLLSATDTGLTASIDPFGRVVAQLPRKQRLALAAPYALASATTLYTRFGDWFASLCAIISLAALVLRRFPARTGSPK
jgi:apolipoprotein N-acyltransferase